MTLDELPDVYRQIRAAKMRATPIITLDSPDQLSSAKTLRMVLGDKYPMVQLDFSRGFTGVNELGRDQVLPLLPGPEQLAKDPLAQMDALEKIPERTVVLFHNADAFIRDVKIAQPIVNIRESFKKRGSMLVLMGPRVVVPDWLAGHIVSFDEPLPNLEQIGAICDRVVQDFNKVLADADRQQIAWDSDVRSRCCDALIGLPSFPSEQLMSMACRDDGTLDFQMLWEGKRQQIAKTKGLTVWRDCSDYDRLGGHQELKDYTRRIMEGNRRPRLIVWLDEIEKTGLANSSGDLSGTDNDQHGQLLSFIEDNQVFLQMYLGPAGTGKSEMVKAHGGEFDVTVIRLDLGAVKGEGLVGQAQNEIRHALKVIEAMGGKDAMWCGTSNSIAGLSEAMKSRCRGIWFFDLPTASERREIWDIQMRRYGLPAQEPPANDEGAVGRDIAGCCDEADRICCTVTEAWESVIVRGESGKSDVDKLRREANATYRSTIHKGPYRMHLGELEERAARAMDLS